MTVAIIGIDGVDSRYVAEHDLLSGLDAHEIRNDFDGENALFTWRIWPCIFSGENGGKSDSDPYHSYFDPDNPWIWERHGAAVFTGLVDRPAVQQNQTTFPDGYHESYQPKSRMERSISGFRDGAIEKLRDDCPLVVTCTRVPDMAEHHLPEEADSWVQRTCEAAVEIAREADDYLIVSDHGFDYENFGTKGIDAHTRHAVFASSFCDYETMTGLVNGWIDELDDTMRQQQMDALGYR